MTSPRSGSNWKRDPLRNAVNDVIAKLKAPNNVATFVNVLNKNLFMLIGDLKTKTFSVIDIQREGMAKLPRERLVGQAIFFLESAAQVSLVVKKVMPGFTEDPLWHKGKP